MARVARIVMGSTDTVRVLAISGSLTEGIAGCAGSSRASWCGAIATPEYFYRMRAFLTFEENVMLKPNSMGTIVAVLALAVGSAGIHATGGHQRTL